MLSSILRISYTLISTSVLPFLVLETEINLAVKCVFSQCCSQSFHPEEEESFSQVVCTLYRSAVEVVIVLPTNSSTETDRMDPQEWICIFNEKTRILNQAHVWHLEFDDNIMPDQLNTGWSQYIRRTSARSAF